MNYEIITYGYLFVFGVSLIVAATIALIKPSTKPRKPTREYVPDPIFQRRLDPMYRDIYDHLNKP